MTPSEFAAKWRKSTRAERAASQEHFIDLCRMLGVKTPNEADPHGEWYAFEKSAEKFGGDDGTGHLRSTSRDGEVVLTSRGADPFHVVASHR